MPYPRPSNLGRLALCPASYLLTLQVWEEKLPAKPETTAGTRIHRALYDQDFAKLDAEEQELAHRCELYESDLLERHGATRAFQQGLLVTTAREAHLELKLSEEDGVILDGTADSFTQAQLPDGEHGIIIDHKTGHKVNLTSLSCQLGAYAAMALQSFPAMIDVVAAGYYPRLRQDFLRVFKREELPGLIEAIKAMLEDAIHPQREITFRPSPEACEYCPALRGCPAARQGVFELERAVQSLDLSSMDSARLGILHERLAVLEKLQSHVRQEVIARCQAGDEGTGYKLQMRQGNRTIPDPSAAWERLADYMTTNDFLACCDLKMGRIDKLVPYELKRRSGCTVAEAKRKMTEILGEAMIRKPSYPVLVKREADSPAVKSLETTTSTEGE